MYLRLAHGLAKKLMDSEQNPNNKAGLYKLMNLIIMSEAEKVHPVTQ